MGSVQSDVECPKCKYEFAWEDFYYKSGEVYVFCDRCGYSHTCTISNRPETEEYPADWKPEFKEEESGGVGATRYKAKGCIASSCGQCPDAVDFEKWFNENKEHIEECQYSFSKDGKWFVKNLVSGEVSDFKPKYSEEDLNVEAKN